jgi:hypothetical protein
MAADDVFSDAEAFAVALRHLHALRRTRVVEGRKARLQRAALSRTERDEILRKTGGRCHICGGAIGNATWQADHVLAYSTGGEHSADNYLPAHSLCNNYRWHYDAEEFQWILKLGVWLRTQIEKGTKIGRNAAEDFCGHDRRRATRRKSVKLSQT